MKTLGTFTIAVNAVGVVIGLIIVGYLVRSATTTDATPVCSGRYPPATQLALQSETGGLLSPIEFEARAGVGEWGARENVKILADDGAPAPAVLEVALPEGSGSAFQNTAPRGGVGFRWRPLGMEGATAACLSYRLWLPEDFEFGGAGILPGLYGDTQAGASAAPDNKTGFAARVMWREEGAGEVNADISGVADGRAIAAGSFVLPRGQWVGLEEEVVLNAPDANDGILRLWIDGKLKIERLDMAWRNADAVTVAGVIADVSYGGLDSHAVAPKATALRLTPPEMQWR